MEMINFFEDDAPKWNPYMQYKDDKVFLCKPPKNEKVLVTDGKEYWIASLVAVRPMSEKMIRRADKDGRYYGWNIEGKLLDPYKTKWMELPRI